MYPNGLPNPGSDEALAMGCKCPVDYNDHGRGHMGAGFFTISDDCPIHKDDPIVIESSD